MNKEDLYEEYLQYVTRRANQDCLSIHYYTIDEVREYYKDNEHVMKDLIEWMEFRNRMN